MVKQQRRNDQPAAKAQQRRAPGGCETASDRGIDETPDSVGPDAGSARGRSTERKDDSVRARRTVGFAVILTEEEYYNLAARHAIFKHRGYPHYLASVAERIAAAHRTGRHVLVGPLLPDQYEGFADMLGLAPDTLQAVQAYNDFVARLGPYTVRWIGQPLPRLLASWRTGISGSADTSAVPDISPTRSVPAPQAQVSESSTPHVRQSQSPPPLRPPPLPGAAFGPVLGSVLGAGAAGFGTEPTEPTGDSPSPERILPLLRRAANQYPNPHETAATVIDDAMTLFSRLVDQVSDGSHTLVCSTTLPYEAGDGGGNSRESAGSGEGGPDSGQAVVHRIPFARRGKRISFPEHGPEYLLWAMFALSRLVGLAVEVLLISAIRSDVEGGREAEFAAKAGARAETGSGPGTGADNVQSPACLADTNADTTAVIVRGWSLTGSAEIRPLSADQVRTVAAVRGRSEPLLLGQEVRFESGYVLGPKPPG
jgi:hypothetical protein